MADIPSLLDRFGPAVCLTAPEDLAPWAADWHGAHRMAPLAVLRPGGTAELSACVAACAAQGLPMVPAGGRTGLCGGAVPAVPAVVIALDRMDRVRGVDARDGSIVVEAGCTVVRVQQAAAEAGRMFPLSFGAEGSAQIGGALSTNAGGVRALRYGSARDLVLGLEVVLPDGTVLDELRSVRKNNTGYDLRHLFLGAEGTLGILAAAALRLVPPLRAVETAFVAVPSPEAALALYDRAQDQGAALVAFELIGRTPLELVARHGIGVRMPYALEAPWHVMVELGGAEPGRDLRTPLESLLAAALEACEAADAVIAESGAQRAAFWKIREVLPDCVRQDGIQVSTDTAVPVSRVPEFLAGCLAMFAARWPEGRAIPVGHLGDGNIHVGLLGPKEVGREAWKARTAGLEEAVNRLAASLGGSFSAEHGIGVTKLPAMAALKPSASLGAMRAIKAALDPRGLMNPGKVLP